MNPTYRKQKKSKPSIAVLDSGIGGLTILTTLQQNIKDANFYYVADYQYFPYGILTPDAICARLEKLFFWLEENHDIDLYVIACNTASTSSLTYLRRVFKKPIVGVVPPVKLAAEISASKIIAVLATEQTAFNDYTKNLIKEFAHNCEVRLIGSRDLVIQAEHKIHQRPVDLELIKKVLKNLVSEKSIDSVALSCTHFPHLIEEFEAVGLKPKYWCLPNEGVAKRVAYVLSESFRPHHGPDANTEPDQGICHIFLKSSENFSDLQKAFLRISKLEVKAESLP